MADEQSEQTITIPLEYAKNIHKALENAVSMGFAMVSKDTVIDMTDEQKERLMGIFNKYHNANCGGFNRHIKRLIDEVETKGV